MRGGPWIVVLVLAMVVVCPAVADPRDTSILVVKVQDRAGRPLPNVLLEVEAPASGTVPGPERTSAAGSASFSLPVGGGYTVRVSGEGYSPQSSEPLKLVKGAVKTVLFVLRRQTVERVVVRGSLEDPGQSRTTLPADSLEDLPILGRAYQNALTLAPGVTDVNHDGNPNVNGARERDFKATIDGIANVDPLTGTYQSEINPEAIDELEIVTTGASVEYGGAIGGFARIITKQGTNTLNATGGIYLRSSYLDGLGSSSDVPTYHDVRPTFAVTGPIVKDRLYFAMFHEYIDKGQPVEIPATESFSLVNFGRSTTVLPGGSLVIVSKGTRNLDKLTWQVSPRNKLTVQFQSDPITTGPLGVGTLVGVDSGYDHKQGGATYQAVWTFQGSSTFFAQTSLGRNRTSVSYRPTTRGIKNFCATDELPSSRIDVYGRTGGAPLDEDYCLNLSTAIQSGSYFRDYSDRRKRLTLKTDMSYYVESFFGVSHTLRAGVIAEHRTYDGLQSLRAVSDWREEPPSLANGGTIGNGVIHRQVFVPGDPDAQINTAEGTNYGFYLEDQFSPHRDLSVRIGARVDQENLFADGFEPFDPAREEKQYRKVYKRCLRGANGIPGNADRCARSGWFTFHAYELFPVGGASAVRSIIETGGVLPRVPERFRISNTNLAPRIALTWSPGSNASTKIFATAGRYFGETFLAVPSFEQGPDSFLYTYPVKGIPYDCHPVPGVPGALDCKYRSVIGADQQASVALASIRQVDRDLRTPHQDEYTAGISRELLPELLLTLTFIRRDYRDQLQDVDVNRHVVLPAGRFSLIALESVHNPLFNEIQLVGNFNASTYRAWQVDLRRRLRRNWELEASYVYSRAQGNAEDFNQTLGNDPALLDDEFGYLDYDVRHIVKVNARTQLPIWNLRASGAVTYQSGAPYSQVLQLFIRDIPQQFGSVSIGYGRTRTIYYPTLQRNDQRNGGSYDVDLGLRKDVPVRKCDLTMSLDVFNALDDRTVVIQQRLGGTEVGTLPTGRQFQLGAKIVY